VNLAHYFSAESFDERRSLDRRHIEAQDPEERDLCDSKKIPTKLEGHAEQCCKGPRKSLTPHKIFARLQLAVGRMEVGFHSVHFSHLEDRGAIGGHCCVDDKREDGLKDLTR
jgi:hypothetical protein